MLGLVLLTSFIGGVFPVVNADAVLLAAALVVPPGSALFLTTFAAASARMSPARFCVAALGGRTLRIAALVLGALLVRSV